jgi:hypothetical protein
MTRSSATGIVSNDMCMPFDFADFTSQLNGELTTVRFQPAKGSAVLATAALALVAGCSGGSSSTTLPADSTSAQSQLRSVLLLGWNGMSPFRVHRDFHFAPQRPALPPPVNSAFKLLAVADGGDAGVDELGPAFKLKGVLTGGLVQPVATWIDRSENLYVADIYLAAVEEFAPASSSPTHTYNSGLQAPDAVTTDKSANVYVTDFAKGIVNEYAQGSNTVLNTCNVTGGNPGLESVALDAAGDVFVSYENGVGYLVEYTGGLAGCNATTLAPTLGFAGGLIFEKDGTTLVAADQDGYIDIIPKPYTAITSQITGLGDPFSIALTKYNHLLFVDDKAKNDVAVFNFPLGTPYKTLNSSNGLVEPYGVSVYQIGKL